MAKKKTTITLDVEMDENHIPENIDWKSSDNNENGAADGMLLSIWDKDVKNTLKIDLWTKNMLVDDMKIFMHQTLLSLSDTFKNATGEDEMAAEFLDFAYKFGEKLDLIKKADGSE